MRTATPWIYSPKFDMLAIIGPPIAVTIFVLIWGSRIAQIDLEDAPTWVWVFLVLGVDVAHVYSSLFRTYFDRDEFRRRKKLYIVVPILCWGIGHRDLCTLGSEDFLVCHRLLRHLPFRQTAIRLLMLYRRGEPVGDLSYRIDQVAIYMATVYPLVYWHTFPRNFQWFSDFDVIHINSLWPERFALVLYVVSISAFLYKEMRRWYKTGVLNTGKVLLLVATAVAWGTGIIIFNGDLTFTLINILSHGIPYMALIWVYQYRKSVSKVHEDNRFLKFFQLKYLPLYVLAVMAFAYFEEGTWDWFIWRDHPSVFGSYYVPLSATALVVLVPLLTMPQATHYVLDAYIWRVNKKGKEEVRAVIG